MYIVQCSPFVHRERKPNEGGNDGFNSPVEEMDTVEEVKTEQNRVPLPQFISTLTALNMFKNFEKRRREKQHSTCITFGHISHLFLPTWIGPLFLPTWIGPLKFLVVLIV